MAWQEIFTLVVVAGTVVVLAKEWLAPAAAVFGGVVVLLVAGVVEPSEALSGFSNPAPITVGALYVVAAAAERTGLIAPLVDGVLRDARGERRALARLLLPSAGASAFLNNTPIVAMLVPAVSRWANRTGRQVSRYLMPLSFAAVLGGMVTVIGTSTNIVVSGLLEDAGLDGVGFFEISRLGGPVALLGVAALLAIAPLLLPDRRPAERDLDSEVREFVVDMTVDPGGPIDGRTVGEAGLRDLSGVFLVSIDRGGRFIAPVGPAVDLHGGDLLRFVGRADDVADLHNRRGLSPGAREHIEGFDPAKLTFYEAVIGPASPLVGHSLKEVGFRGRYQAAVVAIHRADRRVAGKLGSVRLRVGDTLLVLAGRAFRTQWRDRHDFLLVSRLGGVEPARSGKAPVVTLIGIGIVVTAATGLTGILEASLVGAFALVLLGVLSPAEARAAVDLNVLVVIASSFGLGAAISSTGLAGRIADLVVDGFGGLGERGVLLGVVLATLLLTELITNNAAAVLVFPVALAAAAEIGADGRGFAIAVAVAASASFLTPIGYQTNTMVWGPGGYRFGDYARVGAPLTLVVVTVVVALTPMLW